MRSGTTSNTSNSGGVTTIRMKNTTNLIQQKEHQSYMNWLNWLLKKNNKEIQLKNLTTDLENGVNLCIIAEILLQKEIKHNTTPKTTPHKYGEKKKKKSFFT